MSAQRRIGDLNCVIVGSDRDPAPELACILCHGFGAPGSDLVPLGSELVQQEPALRDRVLFVFPQAPLSLASQGLFDGRAWWQIDMFKLQLAVETGRLRDLRKDIPPGLAAAREKLLGMIDALRSDTGLSMSRIVLGGFSQGAMLSTDITLRLEEKPAALVIYSGTLLCEEAWRPLAQSCQGLRVLQSHGQRDPLLPFSLAVELRDMLEQAGVDVEFHPFPGVHTISYPAIQATTRLLKSLLDECSSTTQSE